jgi:hypothetical protein
VRRSIRQMRMITSTSLRRGWCSRRRRSSAAIAALAGAAYLAFYRRRRRNYELLDRRSAGMSVSLLLSWASEDLRTWVRGVQQRADAVGTSGGLVRGVAGVEDRPSDLGAPLLFIAGFVGADGVVLAYRSVDREGVIGDVGCE